MMRHVAAHGDNHQRERVNSTLTQTALIANGRAAPTLIGTTTERTAHKNRRVYDAGHHQILPGMLVMTEKRPGSTDIVAKEAFDGAGYTYDFFSQVFRRNSLDNRGMRVDSTVHYGKKFDNAMWNGKQMVYGDGDGTLFNRFTACLDVIGHEETHGITQFTAGLEYQGQSGALNEHLSDALGIMVKQYRYATLAARSDWYIGAGLLGPGVRGMALRSMKAPGTAYDDPVLGKDPQPSHMRNYVDDADDNGGVHINSGIPNYAFYLTATALRGYSWEVAGRIWYRVQTTALHPNAQFQDFANATVIAAGAMYTVGGNVQLVIADAWSEVGINVPRSLTRSGGQRPAPPTPPANAIVNLQSSTIQPPREPRQKDELFIMSTGQEHHTEKNALSFESINAHVRGLDLAALTAPTIVQETPAGQEKPLGQEKPAGQDKPAGQETTAARMPRLVMSYAAARPILVALAAIPFIPAAWRAVVTAFIVTLDGVTAAFRTGSSDLTAGNSLPGVQVEMEPKLPVG
jgi:hypothetical protein